MPRGVYPGNGKQGFKKGHKLFPGAEKGCFKKGQTPHNKGQKHPEWAHKQTPETKEKIRASKIELYKDKTKHPNYKDGRSFEKWYPTFIARKRKIRKMGNGGYHTLAEWENLKAQYNWTCPCCGLSEPFKQFNKELTEDHIIPLSKGGSDNIENIQPLCRSCNAKKHNKVVKYETIKTK